MQPSVKRVTVHEKVAGNGSGAPVIQATPAAQAVPVIDSGKRVRAKG